MPQIQVQTGDVTKKVPEMRYFRLEADHPLSEIVLTFDGHEARHAGTEWPALLEQVKMRSLSHWKHSRMAPPMGRPSMQELLSVVSNTPAYQLFLAGFDFAEAIGLVSDSPERVVLRRAAALAERLPSAIGPGGLFVVPDPLLGDIPDPPSLEELVRNNKLCRLCIDSGGHVEKYYIPYATPIGFATVVSESARQLWDRIRDYFYAFR
ncbi:MAG TPA: hypothetical protein VMG10_32220 [Gemmataceae bacterium]|nr:hypothetical protein [Gemmataceae bacterium]